MFKGKKVIFTYVLLFMVLGVGCVSSNSQSAESKSEDTKSEKTESDESITAENEEVHDDYEAYEQEYYRSDEYKEAREKIEKMSEEELRELAKKPEENDYQITDDFTEEDKSILDALSAKEYYDIVGMTKEEVLSWIDSYHEHINMVLTNIDQHGVTKYEEDNGPKNHLMGFRREFAWIRDNYEFDQKYHNDLIEEIVDLIDEHANGDNEALFSLKYVLYELNAEFNPETIKEDTATSVTLTDTERIKKGKKPLKSD